MELMFLDQFLLNWVFFGTRVLIFLHNISAIWNNNLKYHTKLIFLDLANADIGHSGKFEFQINNHQFLIPACSKYRTEHAYTKNKCIPYLKLTLEYEFHTSVSFFGEVSKWSILNRLSERYWVHFWVHTLGWMGDDSHWDLQNLSAPEVAWCPDHPQLPGQVVLWRWHTGAFRMSTCLGHKVSIYLLKHFSVCFSEGVWRWL